MLHAYASSWPFEVFDRICIDSFIVSNDLPSYTKTYLQGFVTVDVGTTDSEFVNIQGDINFVSNTVIIIIGTHSGGSYIDCLKVRTCYEYYFLNTGTEEGLKNTTWDNYEVARTVMVPTHLWAFVRALSPFTLLT